MLIQIYETRGLLTSRGRTKQSTKKHFLVDIQSLVKQTDVQASPRKCVEEKSCKVSDELWWEVEINCINLIVTN